VTRRASGHREVLLSNSQNRAAAFGDQLWGRTRQFYLRDEKRWPGPYRTKFITFVNGERRVEFIWRNEDYSIAGHGFDLAATYDARTGPWYIQASSLRQRIWTAPYIFFSSQQPGVTVASPIGAHNDTLRGVVGINLAIADILLFLSDLAIGKIGAAFILSDDGRVIAHPDLAH
jgi:hypothetical protein